jgi:predicted anti-sigma-YlaC factor YlaD
MKDSPKCEDILMAAMAIFDGERSPVPEAVVEEHLAACGTCRDEMEGMAATARRFDGCHRAEVHADLWPALAPRVAKAARDERRPILVPFVLLAVVLVAARVLLALTPDVAVAIKLLAVALAIAAFASARENPFTIKTELSLTQE